MNEIQVFSNPEFGQVRVIEKDGEPWFVATDVCKCLELSNSRMSVSRLDDDEKGVSLTDTLGGAQELTIISESGLYSLVLGSRKPEAKAFKRWITHDVIPSIRKYGMYATPKTLEDMISNPEFAIKMFTELKYEQDRHKKAELESAEKSKIIEHKTDVITGLTKDIYLAEKCQRINQIVRFKAAGKQCSARWSLLYSEFDKKYHMNIKLRYEKNKKNFKPQLKSVVDYVARGLGMADELYELTCKLFESDFNTLLQEWSSTIVLDNVVNGDS